MLRLKVKFTNGTKVHLTVKPWCTIKDVKDKLCAKENIPTDCQRIFFRGAELANTWPLTLAEDRAALFCVVSSLRSRRGANGNQQGRASLEIRGTSSVCAPVLRQAIRDAQRGLQLNLKPILADDGSGGTYFLRGATKQYVAVFKPRDEEPGAVNNPRGYVGEHGQIAANRGIFAGQACDRELAAYLLDHAGMAGVPPTALSEAVHPSFHHDEHSIGSPQVKVGIFQQFVPSDDVAGNLASSMFSVHDVQRIALFDMRLLNTDRNDSNVLVRRIHTDDASGWPPLQRKDQNFTLIPIDHGYCLPQTLNIGWCDWCWLSWKQINEPLSQTLVDYVESLDAEKDAFRLQRETSISRLALRNMRISVMLLKAGVSAGLTLSEIASLMIRNDIDLEVPSELEVAVLRAGALAESMVRSPRMRGNSLSSSPTSPTSPSKKSLSPSLAEIKRRVSESPMKNETLGSPAIAVDDMTTSPRKPFSNLEQHGGGSAAFASIKMAMMRPAVVAPVLDAAGRAVHVGSGNMINSGGSSAAVAPNDQGFDDCDQDPTHTRVVQKPSLLLGDSLANMNTAKSDLSLFADRSDALVDCDYKHSSPRGAATYAVSFSQFEPCLPSVMSVMKGMGLPEEKFAGNASLGSASKPMTMRDMSGERRARGSDAIGGEVKSNTLDDALQKVDIEGPNSVVAKRTEKRKKKKKTKKKLIASLPLASPERKAQRQARRRRSSGSAAQLKTAATASTNERPGCVCSDDERFLRSPARRAKRSTYAEGESPRLNSCPSPDVSASSASSPGTPLMSPKSMSTSPTSSAACPTPKMISRTMSFLDVRSSGLFAREDEPRSILRSATVATSGSEAWEIGVKSHSAHKRLGSTISIASLHTSDAAARLDSLFFSYLGKLFADLVDLKLRARRHASVADTTRGEGKGHPEEHQSSSISDSSSSMSLGEEEEDDNDLGGSFIIED